MTVLLHCAADLPPVDAYEHWAVIGDAPAGLDSNRRVPGLGEALEEAFDAVAPDWWKLGYQLSSEPTASLAHTPACVANLSDFGLMLAWSRLAGIWARGEADILLVTDDPWVFRHLSRLDGVVAGARPGLRGREAKLLIRGYAARVRAALRFGGNAFKLRSHRRVGHLRRTAMLVYGHPNSTSDGYDGYFGTLMSEIPEILRILHVDCPPTRATELAQNGRTFSLLAWGNPLAAAGLVRARWRPAAKWRSHAEGWLIRRAARLEAGTATGAAIRWQEICQRNWLQSCRPIKVTWPWENHSWERSFVRNCRQAGISTIGYQHSVVGRQMLNYAPGSNPDGLVCIPDMVLCSGNATAGQLTGWGIPEERISIGGARRTVNDTVPGFAESAPVFMPLPFDHRVSGEMIAAAKLIPEKTFLVKNHPMTPFSFTETENVRRTEHPLAAHTVLSAVVFAASTVGLESMIAGIPTFRFRPQSCMALDILPKGLTITVVDADTLDSVLKNVQPVNALRRDSIFADVDKGLWRNYLETELCDGKQA